MKLSEKLKQTLKELEMADIKKAEEQSKADMELIHKERLEDENYVNQLYEEIFKKINDGEVPFFREMDYDRRKWIDNCNARGQGRNVGLWNKFRNKLRSEGLQIVVGDGHDGMGMESWTTLTVEPLPDRPRTHTGWK